MRILCRSAFVAAEELDSTEDHRFIPFFLLSEGWQMHC